MKNLKIKGIEAFRISIHCTSSLVWIRISAEDASAVPSCHQHECLVPHVLTKLDSHIHKHRAYVESSRESPVGNPFPPDSQYCLGLSHENPLLTHIMCSHTGLYIPDLVVYSIDL